MDVNYHYYYQLYFQYLIDYENITDQVVYFIEMFNLFYLVLIIKINTVYNL